MAKIETHDELLACDLTTDEVNEKGRQLASLFDDITLMTGKRDAAKKAADGEIKTAEERQRSLAREVRDGREYRNVSCRSEPDWIEKTMATIREDTGEVVRGRALTQDELQRKLGFDAKSEGVKDKKKARRKKKTTRPAAAE